MAPKDEEKITFITDRGLFYYKIMPFGLNNTGTTYQWLVNRIFKEQIDRNIEVYMNDILVKSPISRNYVADLKETFDTLRRYQIKLNPA